MAQVINTDDKNKSSNDTDLPISFYINGENTVYPVHWHTAMEIIMPTKGNYEINFRNKRHMLKEYDILLIPPFDLHGLSVPPGSENGQRIILMFKPIILHSLPALSDVISKLYNFNLIASDKMPAIHNEICSLLLSCGTENQSRDTFCNTVLYARIIEILVILYRSFLNGYFIYDTDIEPGKRQDYIIRLNPVLQYIDNNLTKNISLEETAKVANLSKYHFDRIFKVYTNMSFYKFLKLKRIKKVEPLLLNPNNSVIDIALNSGFGSLSAFNRAFKEIEHCTPSEFRKLYQSTAVAIGGKVVPYTV